MEIGDWRLGNLLPRKAEVRRQKAEGLCRKASGDRREQGFKAPTKMKFGGLQLVVGRLAQRDRRSSPYQLLHKSPLPPAFCLLHLLLVTFEFLLKIKQFAV
ncbi:hypothetical protein BC008_30830 [Mastigocoleus testarum BC008]|uniref:Uncharacterized protein n=1 Tax=Mastigocoleus testarum BC008 TaxID=371196 RepID=A0A0V7ZSR7_9CYAN|nr:hypothetical protein BC008_30830 [Mastigocoleus testarum BC008]